MNKGANTKLSNLLFSRARDVLAPYLCVFYNEKIPMIAYNIWNVPTILMNQLHMFNMEEWKSSCVFVKLRSARILDTLLFPQNFSGSITRSESYKSIRNCLVWTKLESPNVHIFPITSTHFNHSLLPLHIISNQAETNRLLIMKTSGIIRNRKNLYSLFKICTVTCTAPKSTCVNKNFSNRRCDPITLRTVRKYSMILVQDLL